MKRIAILAVIVSVCLYSSVWGVLDVTGPSLRIQWEDENGGRGQAEIGSGAFEQYTTRKGPIVHINMPKAALQQLNERFGLGDNLGLDYIDFSYDPDPFVSGGFSVYNPSGVTQTYTFTFTAPVVPPITPSSLYGGSFSGSISAGASTPATVTTVPNTPLYLGMIDGAGILPIHPDPMSWTVTAPFTSGNITGVTIPVTNIGPQVLNNISMQIKFTLTPDDIATMNGVFTVIPEPATLALLGIGGLLLRKRRV